MSTRRFEFSNEKSNKFWEITEDGNDHTVCYGRIGTDGQSKTKSFDSVADRAKDAARLVAQKTKKGYEEVTGGSDLDGPALQLEQLLSGLCKDGDDKAILAALCEAVEDMDDSTINFSDREAEYQPGRKVVYHDEMPKSFCDIQRSVSSLLWDGGGPEVGYEVGANGESHADAWLFDELEDVDEEEFARISGAGEVVASFVAGQEGMFFDPSSKLDNGEPGLAFMSHEECEWVAVKEVRGLDYGQILLRLFSDSMIDTQYIDDVCF